MKLMRLDCPLVFNSSFSNVKIANSSSNGRVALQKFAQVVDRETEPVITSTSILFACSVGASSFGMANPSLSAPYVEPKTSTGKKSRLLSKSFCKSNLSARVLLIPHSRLNVVVA